MTRSGWLSRMALGLATAAGLVSHAHADDTPPAEATARQVTALIDKLTELDRQDTGYSASVTGEAFTPLDRYETHAIAEKAFDLRPFFGVEFRGYTEGVVGALFFVGF